MNLKELAEKIQYVVLLEYEGIDLKNPMEYVTDRIVSLIEGHLQDSGGTE